MSCNNKTVIDDDNKKEVKKPEALDMHIEEKISLVQASNGAKVDVMSTPMMDDTVSFNLTNNASVVLPVKRSLKTVRITATNNSTMNGRSTTAETLRVRATNNSTVTNVRVTKSAKISATNNSSVNIGALQRTRVHETSVNNSTVTVVRKE